MVITWLTEAWEKEIMKIKYTQDISFPEPQKIVETTLPLK